MRGKKARWTAGAGAILLAAALGGVLFMAGKEEQDAAARMTALQAQVSPYEAEIKQLRVELEARREWAGYWSDCGMAMIGFRVVSPEDAAAVKQYALQYGCLPVIVLDASLGQNTLMEILQSLRGTGYEVVLTASGTFNEAAREQAGSLRQELGTYGLKDTGGFLLRGDDNTAANLTALAADGYACGIVHSATLENDTLESGLVCLNYSFIKSGQTALDTRVEQMTSTKQALLTIFDMGSVADGSLEEADILSDLNLIQEGVSDGTLRYCTVSEAITAVKNAESVLAARQADYEIYAAEQQARIDALQVTVDGIYSRWNED